MLSDLDYDTHLELQKTLSGINVETPHNELDEQDILHVAKQAQNSHALAVFNPLRDWIVKPHNIANRLKNNNAQYYMRHGVGRRFNMMWRAYKDIIFTAGPERSKPLSHEDQQILTLSINVVYMNVRGILDNFAWCFFFEKEPDKASSINKMDVDLFKPKLRKLDSFSDIENEICMHDEWNNQIKERRDPVAHRIPLYIPPSFITDSEADQYRKLNNLYCEKILENDFESTESIFEDMHEIGTFQPFFLHHPEDGLVPLYPTIPTDMAHLIRIGAAIEQGLMPTA